MKYEELPNGDLKISVEEGDLEMLRAVKAERGDAFGSDNTMHEAFEHLIANSELEWSDPAYIGALTSAPVLAIYGDDRPLREDEEDNKDFHNIVGQWCDKRDGTLKVWTKDPIKAWAFMNYQIRSPLDDLLDDGHCIFDCGHPMWKEGTKVVLTTDQFAPRVSKGAVGVVKGTDDDIYIYEIAFSGNRLLNVKLDDVRRASDDEEAADKADPDLDEQFTS